VKICCDAFNVLRRNAAHILHLLGMMLFAKIPELQASTQ
jgi:hypothetical protein